MPNIDKINEEWPCPILQKRVTKNGDLSFRESSEEID